MTKSAHDPLDALRDHFGFASFRPGQETAVRAALAGRDVLVVMPTGAGKSLCYQLPALISGGLSVVVSPLVSLMQDQVEALERIAPGRVALVNAQRDAAANRATLERAAAGDLRLLYVAPERFAAPGFADALRAARVRLFVVDEAHCVSEWGHDFRPDYFRLADAARYVGAASLVALTATATPRVAVDVERRLGLRDPVRVTTGFDRPNLSYAVVRCRSRADKHGRIAAELTSAPALPAIVYAGTRAGAESLASRLAAELGPGVAVAAYHAGLGREQRADVQRRFMAGEAHVVVATNAFGMGIDKADVRTVCHETVPSSLEAYYQEAGRAGRDGRPARALLFAEGRDKGLHVFFIQRAAVDEGALRGVAGAIEAAAHGGRYDVALADLARAAGGEPDRARAVVGHLCSAGVVQPAPAPADRVAGRLSGPLDARALAACRQAATEGERVRWAQYRAIWGFAEGDGCRRRAILRHFGDRAEPAPAPGVPCCDVCDPAFAPGAAPRASRRRGGGAVAAPADLDRAIVEVVSGARPAVGRTRTVEILRGGRSRAIRRNAYDGLPGYGAFDHLGAGEVLARVDELLARGRLRSSGGRYPTLRAA